jgi:alkylation response protein AidB-like acyl-CoA dehydrogenase
MDASDKSAVRASIAGVLALTRPTDIARGLESIGIEEILDEDLEFAVSALFDEQGKALSVTNLLDTLLRHRLGGAPATGVVVVTVTSGLDGAQVLSGWTNAPKGTGRFVVVERTGGEHATATEVGGERVEYTDPDDDIDPDGAIRSVTIARSDMIGNARKVENWNAIESLAARAVSHEALAVGHSMLGQALSHVVSRSQYGRQLGSFQAVKHRLAGCAAELAGAQDFLEVTSAHGDDPDTARIAKALVGRATEHAVAHCQQVCGAMGYTFEFGLHRYVRRLVVLDHLFGPWRTLRGDIGISVAADRAHVALPAIRSTMQSVTGN